MRFDKDQTSVFDQTGLAYQLERDGVRRLLFGGLALDVCVLTSVLDAVKAGFQACLIQKGTRSANPEDGRNTLGQIKAAGADIL